MTYEEKIASFRKNADVDGAFDFLKSVFTAEENQKIKGSPTDYLYDDDELEEKLTPAQGFDEVVKGFQPQMSAREKVDWIFERMQDNSEDAVEFFELAQIFKPLNAFLIQIGDYERCDANVQSGHYSPETGEFERFYGLHHDIIFDGDSKEEYDFVYELENGDQYNLELNGEAIPGKVLYYDLKVTIFTKHLVELVDALVNDDRFAALGKKLPFFFLIQSAEYRDEKWCYEFRTLDAESLAGNEHKQTYLESVIADVEPTPKQLYDFHARYARDPDSPEFEQFVAVCREHRACFDELLAAGTEAQENGRTGLSSVISRVMWQLIDAYPAAVLDFHSQVFQAPIPSIVFQEPEEEPENEDVERIQRHRRERAKLDKPIDVLTAYVEMIAEVWKNVPEDYAEQVRPARDEAWERLRALDHPVGRVLMIEAEAEEAKAAPKKKETRRRRKKRRRRSGSDEDSLPTSPEYVDALVQCISLLPSTHSGYGGGFSWVIDRLTEIGEHAAPAEAGLRKLLTTYCETRHDEQLITYIGEVLFKMGAEEVPPEVHVGYERNQFFFEYYKDWIRKAPDRYWNEFVEAWRSDPAQFDTPKAWETRLHDSEFGYNHFAHQLRELDGDRGIAAVLAAAKQTPGPRLVQLLYSLSGHANKEKKYDEVVRFLECVADLTPEKAEELEYARVAVLLLQLEAKAEGVAELLEQVKTQHPKNATLLFLDVDYQTRVKGAEQAMRTVVEHMRTLTEDDIVYRKAFHEFTDDKSGNFQPAPANVYPLYRLAYRRFRKQCFSGAEFDGVDKSFKKDPFYWAFYGLSDVPEAERTADIAGFRKEYDFLQTSTSLTDEQLIERLDPKDWHITVLIAQQLVDSPTPAKIQALLGCLAEIADDEDKRRDIAFLLWPVAEEEMLKDERFQPHLPWLAWRYPGKSVDLTRHILTRLSAMGLNTVITRIAFDFEDHLVIATFKSFLNAYIGEGDFKGAQKLLRKLLEEVSPKKPDWVLMMSNLAVMHVQGGEMKEAEEVFDELFAQDFSRFDRERNDSDEMMEAIMGGSLDLQLVHAFQTYYRMARFNQACLFALTKRPEKAVEALREAIAKGHYTAEKILAEGDFRSLHGRPDFDALVRGLRQWNDVPEQQQLVRIARFEPRNDDGRSISFGQFIFHRDHVYAVTGESVRVLDISDVSNPQQVGIVEFQENVYGLAAKEGVLYVSEWTRALNLVDISDPRAPRAFDCIPLIGTPTGPVARVGDHLVQSCGRDKQILLLDISDPKTAWRAGEVQLEASVEDLRTDGRNIYVANGEKGVAIYQIQDGKLEETIRVLEEESFQPQNVFVGSTHLYVWGYGDDDDRDLWVLDKSDPSEVLAAFNTDLSSPDTMHQIGSRAVFFHSHSTLSVMEGLDKPRKVFRQYTVDEDGRHLEVQEGDELEERCSYTEHPRFWEIREGRLFATQSDDGFQVYEFRPGGLFDK